MKIDISPPEDLILGFNLHQHFFGSNLYEKLVFLQRILPLVSPREILHRTNLGIPIGKELTENIDQCLQEEFKSLLISGGITLKSLLQLISFSPEGRESLIHLFEKAPFTASQQFQILEMVEEICFREKVPVQSVFEQLQIPGLLKEDRPQGSVVQALAKHRFPQVSEMEKQWKEQLAAFKLPSHFNAVHSPNFDREQVDLTIRFRSQKEFFDFLLKNQP